MATTRVYISRALLRWLREQFENKFVEKPNDNQIVNYGLRQLKANITGEEQRWQDDEDD